MQITRSGIDTTKGPADWFTGDVYLDAVAVPAGTSTLAAASVDFTPGARTAWHTHPHGQTIYGTTPGWACSPRAGRLNDAIMLMVARWQRRDGDELRSPLVMPALVLGGALATLLARPRRNPAAAKILAASALTRSGTEGGCWFKLAAGCSVGGPPRAEST